MTADVPRLETAEDAYRHFESGGEPFAVRDTLTRLWLIWDNADGDVYATSWPEEDQIEGFDAVSLDDTSHSSGSVRFPATVLTPATPERTEQDDNPPCPRCGGLNGAHGLVHERHPQGGGGTNKPCPNTPERTVSLSRAASDVGQAIADHPAFTGPWIEAEFADLVLKAARTALEAAGLTVTDDTP